MVAYTKLSGKLEDIYYLLNKNEIDKAKEDILDLIKEIKARRQRDTQKTLEARRKSKRQRMMHNLDNKYRYALKIGNNAAAEKFLKEKEIVRKTIFD